MTKLQNPNDNPFNEDTRNPKLRRKQREAWHKLMQTNTKPKKHRIISPALYEKHNALQQIKKTLNEVRRICALVGISENVAKTAPAMITATSKVQRWAETAVTGLNRKLNEVPLRTKNED